MNGIAVRRERPADAPVLGSLITAAFADAPHSSGTEAAIVDRLRDAGALRLSLVAEDRGGVVGHVAFSPVTIDDRDNGWLALGPIAVSPDRQRAGIGSALIRHGLAILSGADAAGCVLLGDPAYYHRFGFANDPALFYRDFPPPYLQRLPLAGSIPGGEVRFHPAFDG